jgi:hypothetical protein
MYSCSFASFFLSHQRFRLYLLLHQWPAAPSRSLAETLHIQLFVDVLDNPTDWDGELSDDGRHRAHPLWNDDFLDASWIQLVGWMD